MSMALPSRGSLADTSFAELMISLTTNKATGKLEVSKAKVKRVLLFEGGRLVSMTSNALSDSFGRILLSTKKVDATTAQRIRKESHQAGVAQEDWVIQQGILSASEANRFLMVQAQVRLMGTVGWTDGTFRFLPLDSVKSARGFESLPMPRVVLKALRRQPDSPHLRMAVIRRSTEMPRLAVMPPYSLSTMGLSAEETALARKFDGNTSVSDVLMTPGLPPSDVMTLVYSLYCSGMVFLTQEVATPRAKPKKKRGAASGQRAGAGRAARIPAAAAVPAPPSASAPNALAPNAFAVPPPSTGGAPGIAVPSPGASPMMAVPPPGASPMMAVPPPPSSGGSPMMAVPPPPASGGSPMMAVPPPGASPMMAVPAPAVPAPAVPAPVVVAPVVAPPPKATPKPPIAAPSPQRAFPAPRVAPGAASTQAGVGAGTGHVAANVAVPISEPPAAVPVTAPAAIPTAVPAPPAAMVMPIGEDTVDEVPEAPVSSLGFIDAMIAEEVGEYDGDVPVAQTNSAESPLLTFSMAGFSEADMALSKRFKEDFLRMKGENHFELLGIDRQVGSADVRKAYFKLVNDYHPDKLVGKPEAIQNLGAEIFNTIQDVYDTLTDSERRESYVAKVFYGREMEEEEAAVTTVETVFKADTFFKQGIGILNAGDLKGAHRAFEHAVEIYPQEPEYRACLGYTTFVLNYPKNKEIWQGAETLIQEALKENAKLDRGNYFMGQISLTKGKSTLARKYFVRALKANAKNVDAMKAYQRLKNAPKEEDKGVLSSLFSVFKK